ncbi:hypothetical protein LC607_19220 [Nostoc sp. CHAB 5824]|nr:hypothetical protein [Nostoc sp. CHAB 5824]
MISKRCDRVYRFGDRICNFCDRNCYFGVRTYYFGDAYGGLRQRICYFVLLSSDRKNSIFSFVCGCA